MTTARTKRLERLEATTGLPERWRHRDPETMTDAQLILLIESADAETLARWPDWGSMTLEAKLAALVGETKDEERT